jgi:hypothetical protein
MYVVDSSCKKPLVICNSIFSIFLNQNSSYWDGVKKESSPVISHPKMSLLSTVQTAPPTTRAWKLTANQNFAL